MADYTQPPDVNRRVRFFDGQYLVDQDFVDEQKYHLDRERRMGKLLHITGVVEGLAVRANGANKIAVSPGTALDAEGRQLVLTQERIVDLPRGAFNNKQGIRVLVVYREEPVDMATTGSLSERRWLEDPRVVAVGPDGQSTESWPDTLTPVVLAQVRLDGNGNVTVDGSFAQRAGLRLPGRLGVGTPGDPDADAALHVVGSIRLGDRASGTEATLTSNASGISIQDNDRGERLTITQGGSVGVGTTSPAAKVDIASAGNVEGQAALHLRSGNTWNGSKSSQLTFGDNGMATHRHAVKSRHNGGARSGNAIDFYVWNQAVDKPETVGTLPNLTLDGGFVGIGTTTPRTALDTALGVMSGAANDYLRAQMVMTGGGTVSWMRSGPEYRLRWTEAFLVAGAEAGTTFRDGIVEIEQPKEIPADNCYDKALRRVGPDGMPLRRDEVLYAAHTPGGKSRDVAFYLRQRDSNFFAPGSWLLVGVVLPKEESIRLGNGVTLAVGSSSTNGSPIPRGTIVMWSGKADELPGGWVLCEGGKVGDLVVPDLRGRFVMGASKDLSGDLLAGGKGEVDAATATATAPNVTVSISGGEHNHLMPTGWGDSDAAHGGAANVLGTRHPLELAMHPSINRGQTSVDTVTTPVGGGHGHNATGSASVPTVTVNSGRNRPAWYALCYIIKL